MNVSHSCAKSLGMAALDKHFQQALLRRILDQYEAGPMHDVFEGAAVVVGAGEQQHGITRHFPRLKNPLLPLPHIFLFEEFEEHLPVSKYQPVRARLSQDVAGVFHVLEV